MAFEDSPPNESISGHMIASDDISPCLWFDLKIDRVSHRNIIFLTAVFGQHWCPILWGTIDFALSEAEFHFEAIGGSIPPASRWPENPLHEETVIKRTKGQAEAATRQSSTHAGAGAGDKGPSAKFTSGREKAHEQRQNTNDEFEFLVKCISSSGSPTRPVWRFAAPPGQDHLAGALIDKAIGELVLHENSERAVIEVRCKIKKRYIQVIDSDGLIASRAANSKSVVIQSAVRREILRRIENCLQNIRQEAGSNE
jgi:hypothetical protein